MDLTIGKCGIACELCKNFNKGCFGCETENFSKHACIIFKCAEKKNVRYCQQYCGVSMQFYARSFQIILSRIHFDKNILSENHIY